MSPNHLLSSIVKINWKFYLARAISTGEVWAAIVEISNKVFLGDSVNDGTQPNFAWVGQGYDGDSTHALGYEPSFSLAQGIYLIILHIQVFDDGEWQTSATAGLKAGIDLHVIPETAVFTTLIGTLAAGGIFVAYKKRSNHHI